MMKNKKNYQDGIKILEKYLYENHLYTTYYDISNKYKWIFKLSEILSDFGLCKIFWEYTIEQNGINQIYTCKTIYDVFYDTYFFLWEKTKEGDSFWLKHSSKVIDKFHALHETYFLNKEYENNDLDELDF